MPGISSHNLVIPHHSLDWFGEGSPLEAVQVVQYDKGCCDVTKLHCGNVLIPRGSGVRFRLAFAEKPPPLPAPWLAPGAFTVEFFLARRTLLQTAPVNAVLVHPGLHIYEVLAADIPPWVAFWLRLSSSPSLPNIPGLTGIQFDSQP